MVAFSHYLTGNVKYINFFQNCPEKKSKFPRIKMCLGDYFSIINASTIKISMN